MPTKTHRIDLIQCGGNSATMFYKGESIGESSEPLFAAARILKLICAAINTDRIETWRGNTMCLAGPVGAASKLSVRNNIHFGKSRAEDKPKPKRGKDRDTRNHRR